eukprot:gene30990-7098_t
MENNGGVPSESRESFEKSSESLRCLSRSTQSDRDNGTSPEDASARPLPCDGDMIPSDDDLGKKLLEMYKKVTSAPPPRNTERMSYGLDTTTTKTYLFYCIGRMLKTHEHEEVIWIHTNVNSDVHQLIMDNLHMLEYCQRMNVLYVQGYPPHVSPSGLNTPSEGTDNQQILSTPASSSQAPKPIDMRGLLRKFRMWKGSGLHMNLNVSSMKMSLRQLLSMIPGATANVVRKAAALHPDQACIEDNVDEQSEVIKSLVLENKNVKLQNVAGSGKTTLSLHCVTRLHALFPDARSLLLTYNSNLKTETRKKVAALGLESAAEVHSFHSFGTHYYDEGCHTDEALDTMVDAINANNGRLRSALSFRLVVVDEAQDINPLYWKIIVMIARLCHRPPQFLFIGDPRQSIYEYKGASPRFLAECDSLLPSETSVVFDLLTRYRPDQIMVLSPSVKKGRGKSPLRLLEKRLLDRNVPLSVNDVFEECSLNEQVLRGKLAFMTFHGSKGTEREAVVVLGGTEESYMTFFQRMHHDAPLSSSTVNCPNPVYVSLTRAKRELIVVHNMRSHLAPYMDATALLETATLQGCPPASASKKDVTPEDTNDDADIRPNERGVCSLLEHLPFQTIKRASAHLTWSVQDIGVRAPALCSTVRTRGALAEYVADLDGIAIPAILEYRVTGRSQLLDMLPTLNMSSSKYCGNLRDALASRISSSCDPSVSDFLCAATLHQSSASQYFYRAKQITRFDWLDEVDVESSLEVMRGAGICGGVVERFEVPLRREFVPKACHVYGEADVVTEDSLYELKCTCGEVQLVHILQTALYAWMHGDDRKRIRLVYLLSGTVCDIDYDIASFEIASGVSFDASEILIRFLQYIFEGLMVAVAAYFIPNTKLPPKDLMMISLVGAATFAVLDLFAPAVGSSVRNGAGFGIGANLVGFPGGGMR